MISRVSVGGAGLRMVSGLVFKITAASSSNGGGRVLGLLYMEWNGMDSNVTVYLDFLSPVRFFLSFGSSDRICIVTSQIRRYRFT